MAQNRSTASANATPSRGDCAEDLKHVMEQLTVAIGNMNRHIKPPPYQFDPAVKSVSISDFFRSFEPYAAHTYGPKGNNSEAWLVALRSFLLGDAQRSLSAMRSNQLDYDTVKQNLVSLFTPRDILRTGKISAFMTAMRQPGETFPVYAMRLTGLAASAFGAMADRDNFIISKLMESLSDEVRAQVTVQISNMPNPTLDTVVQIVSALEPFIRRVPPSVRSFELQHFTPTSMSPDSRRERTEAEKKLKSRLSATEAIPKSRACFECGEVGHFARNCPKRRQAKSALTKSASGRVVCQYCDREGHVLAKCQDFKKDFCCCIWCGKTDHKAFECSKKPSEN
jgi:hypothetical protein